MKKDKEIFRITKDDIKEVNGIKNTLKALKMAKLNKKLFAGVLIIFTVRLALNTIFALLAKDIFAALTNENFNRLFSLALLSLILDIILYIFEYLNGYYFQKFRSELILSLKTKTFERVNSLQAKCIAGTQTSTFSQRLNDAGSIVDSFNVIFNMITTMLTTFAYTIILFSTSPILSACVSVFYLIKAISAKFIVPRHNVLRRRARRLSDKAHNVALETIRGQVTLKV